MEDIFNITKELTLNSGKVIKLSKLTIKEELSCANHFEELYRIRRKKDIIESYKLASIPISLKELDKLSREDLKEISVFDPEVLEYLLKNNLIKNNNTDVDSIIEEYSNTAEKTLTLDILTILKGKKFREAIDNLEKMSDVLEQIKILDTQLKSDISDEEKSIIKNKIKELEVELTSIKDKSEVEDTENVEDSVNSAEKKS